MRKSLFILTPLFATLLATSSLTQAASNGQITISGSVVDVTCDVSVPASLNLGNFARTAFSTVSTPVAGSTQPFKVALTNCTTPAADATANVIISGNTLAGNTNIFNKTDDIAGVMISTEAEPTTYLKSGDKIQIAKAAAASTGSGGSATPGPTAGDFNQKTLTFQAGLASIVTTPDARQIEAPITFSFAYN